MSLTLEQLLRIPEIDSSYGFDLAPDGSRLAFSWNETGAWEIYEARFTATAQGAGVPQLITGAPGAKFHPRYSPDGSRLAYALDLDGSESFHIAVVDLHARRHLDLTPDIPFAHQPNMSWSPDGRWLAVISDAAGQFALYTLPAGGGSPRLLFDPGHPCWDARWSPVDDSIAVEVEWHTQDRSIFLVNARDGQTRQLQEHGVVFNAFHPEWSPDGRTLAFSADPGGWHRIGLYDLATQSIRWLEQATAEDTSPAWSPDGHRLVCIRSRGADTSLRVHDLVNDASVGYRLGPGIYSHPRFTHDGQSVLFSFQGPRSPDDLWRLDLAGGGFTQLTHSLPDDLATDDLIIPEEVWLPSSDGVMLPAMLYRPRTPDARALVNIHGGPNWLFQCNWYPFMSYLASQGWTVLAPNYRGSTGYGRAWTQANYMRLGEADTFDCAAGAQYLVREKLADPDRIAVSGRSHGGYLTMTCLTEHPELWSRGSAVVPFLNWFTCHQNVREDLQHWDLENFGDPVENADLWRRRSPYFYLDRIRAAVQLICSGNDPRCPASESIAARDRLLELGRQVELIVYPDEGHALLNIENIVDQEARRVQFLGKMMHPGS